VFDGEDEWVDGFGVGVSVAGEFKGEGDLVLLADPVGVPGLMMLVVPFLVDDGGTVGGELDGDDAVYFGGEASTTGVEAFEGFCFESGRGDGEGSDDEEDDAGAEWHRGDRTQSWVVGVVICECRIYELGAGVGGDGFVFAGANALPCLRCEHEEDEQQLALHNASFG
jgi:hypothetical protein